MATPTIKEIELLLDKKLKPISDQIADLSNDVATIKRDLSEIRHHLGYGNLHLVKDDKEEM